MPKYQYRTKALRVAFINGDDEYERCQLSSDHVDEMIEAFQDQLGEGYELFSHTFNSHQYKEKALKEFSTSQEHWFVFRKDSSV